MTSLDIVVPVYNEGRNILTVLESFRQHVRTPIRVLICYDFDDDDTLRALDGFVDPPFPIIRVKNRGRGLQEAVVTGFRLSDAPAVLVFPADDFYNAGIIDTMYQRFLSGSEIVAGSRFMYGGRLVGCPWLKAFLTRCASYTLHKLTRFPIHDATNGFRLFSRRVITELPIESTQGFALSLELLVKAHRRGWPITEVPAVWIERTEGRSRFRTIRWLPAYLRWYFYALRTMRDRVVSRAARNPLRGHVRSAGKSGSAAATSGAAEPRTGLH